MGDEEILEVDPARIGHHVRQLRRELGFTPKELAEVLSGHGITVSGDGLTKWENGSRRIPAHYLPPLAVALECTPNYLLLGDLEDDSSPERVRIGSHIVTLREAWAWACGYDILEDKWANIDVQAANAEELLARGRDYENRALKFMQRNRPHDQPPQGNPDELAQLWDSGRLDEFHRVTLELLQQGVDYQHLQSLVGNVWINANFNSSGEEGPITPGFLSRLRGAVRVDLSDLIDEDQGGDS